jgi:diguanylate cyclase (GGDEF)-like protein
VLTLAVIAAFVGLVGIALGANVDDVVDAGDAGRALVWLLAGCAAMLWAFPGTSPVPGQQGRIDGRTRAGRILLSLAFLSYGIGDTGGALVVAVSTEVPIWSWADIAWLAFYPLMACALVLLAWSSQLAVLPRLRVTLDAILVTLGTLSAWALLLQTIGATRLASEDTNAIYGMFAYLALDVALLGLIAALANSNGGTLDPLGVWLSAVLITLALADLAYWLVDGADATQWWWLVDAAFLIPPLVLVFAIAVWQQSDRRQAACAPDRKPVLRSNGSAAVLPLLSALCAVVVLLVVTIRGSEPVISALAVVAVTAVVIRLWIAYLDSRALALSRIEARTDDLTGLPNRRAVLSGKWPDGEIAARTSRAEGQAVLIMELNRVLEIEDAIGQAAGDQLLLEVARRLRPLVVAPVRLARLDGDKFAVVLPDVNQEDVEPFAYRLLAVLDESLLIGELSVHLTATIGAAWTPHPGPDHREQYRRADVAKNVATRQGRQLAFYHRDLDDASERLRLVVLFEKALEDSRGLQLHYQPIVDLDSGQGAGVEALLRWTMPDGASVPPSVILPLIRTAGLSERLGAWVIDQAMMQAAQWKSEGLSIPVSINVDAESVTPELSSQFAERLKWYGLPADLLTVEFLEDSALGDNDDVNEAITRLHRLGLHLAIDDFGTGWSGLSYLRTLNVDSIKLDRSFVSALPTDAAAYSIVASIVSLASQLGLIVVGEGIETEAERFALHELGCHRGQGFSIGRPMPAADLKAWWIGPVSVTPTQSSLAARAERRQ